MTWRVMWHHGSPFPEHHDFAYEQAAEHFADILREIGRQHVTIHHLDSTETEKP